MVVDNCIITGIYGATTQALVRSSNKADTIVITNNKFFNGAYGVYLGSATSIYNYHGLRWNVSGNLFTDQSRHNLRAHKNEKLLIHGNTFLGESCKRWVYGNRTIKRKFYYYK